MNRAQVESLSIRDEIHEGPCRVEYGPKGGVRTYTVRWRVNGRLKTWKREPTRFMLPIKYGLKECSYVNQWNMNLFHLPNTEECGLNNL